VKSLSPKQVQVEVVSDALSPFVCLQSPHKGIFDDNSFLLLPNSSKKVAFTAEADVDVETFAESLEVIDLHSTYF